MDSVKKNYIVFFYFYFVLQTLHIIIHTYLPIYFFIVLNVDRRELAIVQILSYITLFSKVLFSIYFDKKKSSSKRKIIIWISSLGMIGSYILFIFNLELLLIFGIFIGIYFIFLSLLDVSIDKTILENSPTEKIKTNNTIWVRLGFMVGSFFPIFIFLIIFTYNINMNPWMLFFLFGFFAIIPLLFITLLIDVNEGRAEEPDESKRTNKIGKINYKNIILMSLFMFLTYGDRLYEYPFEPWALIKYFNGNFTYFNIFVLVIVLMVTLGIIIGGTVFQGYDNKKILFLGTIIIGILHLIIPFTNLIFFILLVSILMFTNGILFVHSMIMIINLSKERVVYFQLIFAFVILATVIFIPLGTYLSAIIDTELIIVIAGILILISLIPLILIKKEGNISTTILSNLG